MGMASCSDTVSGPATPERESLAPTALGSVSPAPLAPSSTPVPTPAPSDGDGNEQTSPVVAKPTHLPEPSASTSEPDASSTASPSPPARKDVAIPAPTPTAVAAPTVAPITVPAAGSRGPAPAGASGSPTSELVEENEPGGTGSAQPAAASREPDKDEVLYTWDDGGRTRRVWLQTDLTVQSSADDTSGDAVVRRGDSESIGEQPVGLSSAELLAEYTLDASNGDPRASGPTAYRTLQLRSFFGSLRVAVYRLSTTTMCVEISPSRRGSQ